MYIDNHLHLDEPWLRGKKKRQAVINDISENQIVTFAQSCSIPSYERVLDYSKRSKYIFPTFGILPRYAHNYAHRLDEVTNLCKEALMLGEIGLNNLFKRSIPHQRPLFEVFLEAAEKNNLIMNVLLRGTEEEGFEALKSYNIRKVVFHSYGGSLELMDDIVDQGYFFSIGPVNLSKLTEDKVRKIPDGYFVMETVVLPSGTNFVVPSVVFAKLLKSIAEIRSTTAEELEALNHKNVLKLIDNDPRLSEITELLEN
ncbi:MAG: TatD family hydrolase [Candidatus Heimdallarchaeota archaeon]